MKKSKVYLVGAGPGKPDLITLRGLLILKEADVIVYDYLVDKGLLQYAKEGAQLICCDRLAKKGIYSHGSLIHQEKISDMVVEKARGGKKVVRLKNGDVSIFSRLSQELQALTRNKIDYELVPGVTAASAAASYAGIPLTDRKSASTCVFVTGCENSEKKVSDIDWQALSKIGTLVIYMAVGNLSKIVGQLLAAGRPKDTACVIVQNAALVKQKILTGTLEDIAQRANKNKIKPPAIIIVGNVSRLESRFNWFKKKKKVLFTGLSKERFFIKDNYFHLPMIQISPLGDYRKFDSHLRKVRDYDWVVFASRYGVEYFFQRLKKLGLDSRALGGIKIAAVGNSTKMRLLDFGVKADLVPVLESSKGLVEEFEKIDLKGKKIFLPRSDIADKGLESEFRRLGAEVSTAFAYRNIPPGDLPDLDLEAFDEIFFTSPSTVRNFKKRYKRVPEKVKIRHIGEVTLREIRRCRLRG
jgi:uroporphyrinogen III methyltransferase/synthase